MSSVRFCARRPGRYGLSKARGGVRRVISSKFLLRLVVVLTDTGSPSASSGQAFDCVRLAPHFAQDDRVEEVKAEKQVLRYPQNDNSMRSHNFTIRTDGIRLTNSKFASFRGSQFEQDTA